MQAYKGADRRTSRGQLAWDVASASAVRLSGAVLVVAVVPVAFTLARSGNATPAGEVAHVVAAALAVTAGASALLAWRLHGRAFSGWFGAAMLAYGVLGLADTDGGALSGGRSDASDPLVRLLLALPLAYLTIRALRAPEIDAGLGIVGGLLWGTAAGLVALGAVDLWTAGGGLGAATSPTARTIEGVALLVVLVGLAGATTLSRRQRGPLVPVWALVVLVGLVVAAGILVAGPGGSGLLAGGVVQVGVLGFGTGAAAVQLTETLAWRNSHAKNLWSDLARLDSEVTAERAELEARLHDLRNAVTAVRSADTTLRRYAGRLDEATRTSLSDALSSELGRLQVLIEPDRSARRIDFDVAAALGSMIDAERAAGADIDVSLGRHRALGDPDALVQVVQNLLVNARRYAPGSRIRMGATSQAGTVRITVADDGPGIPDHERVAVFGARVRGTTSTGVGGDGMGLCIASRLMGSMGGRLDLSPAERTGACFVAELPTAARDPQAGPRTPSTASNGPAPGGRDSGG